MPNRVLICGMPGSGTRATVKLLESWGFSTGGTERYEEPRNLHDAFSGPMTRAFKGIGRCVGGPADGPFSRMAIHYIRIRGSLTPDHHARLAKIAQDCLEVLFTNRDVVKHPMFSAILPLLDLTRCRTVVQVRDAKRFIQGRNCPARNPAMWYLLLNNAFTELKAQKIPYLILRYEDLALEEVQNALADFAGVDAQFNEWLVNYPSTGRFANQDLPLPRGPQEFRGIRVLPEDIRELQHTLGY